MAYRLSFSIAFLGRGEAALPALLSRARLNRIRSETVSSPDRIIQSHGSTVVHGVWFLWFSWTMGIKRLDRYLSKVRVGSASEPSC
jgi:hypothetical protein